MSDSLDQLFLLDSILHGFAEMKPQLVGAIQSDQGRDGDKAAIAFG